MLVRVLGSMMLLKEIEQSLGRNIRVIDQSKATGDLLSMLDYNDMPCIPADGPDGFMEGGHISAPVGWS